MTASELKASILDQAIRGKLVPQDPTDEPAGELLKRIAAEKAKLPMKGRGRTQAAPLPITDDEKPFEIPESWAWCRLGNVFDVARGGSPRPIKEYITDDPSGLNWIKIGDTVKGSKYINSVKERIIPEGLKKTRQVYKGDLLLTNSMSFGEAYILNVDGCIHDGWLVLHPKHTEISRDYFVLMLGSPFVYSQFRDSAAGAVVQNLNSDKARDTIIPLPPLAEQKRIVAKIEELMPHVERYGKAETRRRELVASLPTDLKKSILQEAIQGKLVSQDPNDEPASELLKRIAAERAKQATKGRGRTPAAPSPITDDEKPFEIPDGWSWVRFQDVVSVESNLVPPESHSDWLHIAPDNIEKGTARLLPCRSVAEDKVKSPNHLVPKGRLIYSKIRPLLRKVVIAPFDCLCSADMYPLETSINKCFLVYLILSEYFNRCVAYATASRVKMPKINQEELSQIPIPLPPLAEQKRIVAKVEELLAVVGAMEDSCKS